MKSLNLEDICYIALLQYDIFTEELALVPAGELKLAINAIRSTETTTEEQVLGHFTCKHLKKLSNWLQWKSVALQQLDRYY